MRRRTDPPAGVRPGVRPAVGRPGLAREAADAPAPPGGRGDHRGGRAAVLDWCGSTRSTTGHVKCNRQKLTELPALWGHSGISPSGIVPQGPDLSRSTTSPDRPA